ncbi:PAS domain-containing sensor histidine kinase [Thalassotalea maritima]|uniref:sensor histidine kinase n=1 Tax=Thalassotalea maritima TaxID=3242416 RepID=UPI003529A595
MDVTSGASPQSAATVFNPVPCLQQEAFAGELAQLRVQAGQLQQLFNVMPMGVIVINDDGVITNANEAAQQLFACTLVSKVWVDVIKQFFQPKEDDGHEISLVNGRRIKLDIAAFNGNSGQLILLTDLTETRLLQDEISQLQRLSALGQMMSTLAHQIRTPLSAALLYSANLQADNLSSETKHKFQNKLLLRLQELEKQVSDMLLYAKDGRKQVVGVVSVDDMIRKTLQQLEHSQKQSNAELHYQGAGPAPVNVVANETALMGALQNLIQNAIEAVNVDAVVEITVVVDKQTVWIDVIDNGDGVAKQDVDKVFEPFYTSKIQGTGLGLAVVKAVAQAHHGDASVVCSPVDGGHFRLSLPLYVASKRI